MKAKKTLVYKSAFPKSFTNYTQELFIIAGISYLKITKKKIAYALISQSLTKTPSYNKINFQIIYILWK